MSKRAKDPEVVIRFVRMIRAFLASVFTYVIAELYFSLGRAVGTLPALLSSLTEAQMHAFANAISAFAFLLTLFVPSGYADLKIWRQRGGKPFSWLTMIEAGVVLTLLFPALGSAVPGATVERTVGIFKHASNQLLPIGIASLVYLLLPYIWTAVVLVTFWVRGRRQRRAEKHAES